MVCAALGRHDPRAGQDLRAAFGGIERVENDEPRILHEPVGIDEGSFQPGLQRRAGRMRVQIDRLGTARGAGCSHAASRSASA